MSRSQLHRRFSPIQMLLLSINGMVGSAWLFAPMYAAKLAGPAVMISWLLGGGATILIALTFAELSTMLPIAGGTTRFAQLSHGAITGYVISWISWLSCVTMAPIEVQAVLQYASTFFPSLTHMVNGLPVLTLTGLSCATLVMLALCIVNITSFKGLVGFNFVLFAFKVLVIVATICLLMKAQFRPANFIGVEHWGALNWPGILTAIASGGVAFAFTGFKHGVELAGEATRAQVTIPLAIVGSVVCCLLMYMGLQLAFLGALNPADFANGWDKLTFPGDIGPFVGIAGILGLALLVKFLYVDAAVSPLGAGLIYVTSTARIIYAMSKTGYLPEWLAKLNKERMPIAAISLNFVVGMFLFLPLPGWQTMVSFLVSAVVISYAMGPIALLCLRRQMPDQKRAFRLPAANILCLIAFYCCNLISYWTGWETISRLAIAVLIGLIFLVIAYLRGKVSEKRLGLRSLLWLIPYLSGLTLISYFGSFGGGKAMIGFGWDFLIIAVFSVVILWLALKTRVANVEEQFKRFLAEERGAETA